jgi:hypothetical protein
MRCLDGFYENATNANRLKVEFLIQLNQCWLYCPDKVIKKGYAFLETVHTGEQFSDEVKEKAMGDFIVTIRKDLLPRRLTRKTSLSSADFRHFKANQ